MANALTVTRFICALAVCLLLERKLYGEALLVFVAGALTDLLDGLLARKLFRPTLRGALLDPLADKALVLMPLYVLAEQGRADGLLSALLALRELVISYLRAEVPLRPSALAKLKTAVSFTAVGLAIAGSRLSAPALAAAVLLAYASAVSYAGALKDEREAS
ncbi:MAG: CDP-alcohol phosphatidyltransferase family protein [Aquificae bacterium]|nr:CDP-alcohol phosphatidyltransferase family protein [Aquificota bacterium]